MEKFKHTLIASCYFSGSSCTNLGPWTKSTYMEIQPCSVVLCFWLWLKPHSLFQVVGNKSCLECTRSQYTYKTSCQISQYSCVTTDHKEVKSNHIKRHQTVKWTQRPELWPKLNGMQASNFILVFQLLEILLHFLCKIAFQRVEEETELQEHYCSFAFLYLCLMQNLAPRGWASI